MRSALKALAPEVDLGHTHLIARVGPYNIAVPINIVISVHEAPLVFAVPCAQPGIAGAVQFQGLAVPVFDLRRSLRLEPKAVAESDRLILVHAGVRILALIVDEVREFATIHDTIESGPDSLFGDAPINKQIIAGIACAPAMCAVIDPAGLVKPDPWEAATVADILEQRVSESHPLQARTAALARAPKPADAVGIEAALFRIGSQRFGVALAQVIEFFTAVTHVPVPVRSGIAVSLINRRGEGIMLFDPRPILGLPAAPLAAKVDGLVLAGERCAMAVPVDKLEGLGVLGRNDVSRKPGRFCLSVHPDEQGAVLLLDVPAFLHHAQSAFGDSSPSTIAVA